MAYRIIYVDDARNDVRKARVWYKKQRQGLQKNFAIVIQNANPRIGHNPYFFAIRYRNIRTTRSPSCSEGSTGITNKLRSPERLHFPKAK